jgi:hypothetical protein
MTRDSFYQELKECLSVGINPDCLWNLDEKGFQMNGGSYRSKYLVDSEQSNPKYTANEDRCNVTIMECISASGGRLTPLLIHPGAAVDLEWVKQAPGNVK